jgi:hypothetical protein
VFLFVWRGDIAGVSAWVITSKGIRGSMGGGRRRLIKSIVSREGVGALGMLLGVTTAGDSRRAKPGRVELVKVWSGELRVPERIRDNIRRVYVLQIISCSLLRSPQNFLQGELALWVCWYGGLFYTKVLRRVA